MSQRDGSGHSAYQLGSPVVCHDRSARNRGAARCLTPTETLRRYAWGERSARRHGAV